MPEFNLDSLLKQITASQEKANKANLERYGELLVHLDGLAKQIGVEGTYGAAMKQLEVLGTAGRTRIAEQTTKAQAATEQDLMTRGLASTTVRTAARGAISRDAERATQELEERVATSKSGLLTQRAGAELQIGGMKAGAMERRTDVGPDMALYASLIKAAVAADTTTAKRTATIMGPMAQAGRDVFGQLMGRYGGGGGGGGLTMGGGGGGGTPAQAAPTGGATRWPETGTTRGLIDPHTGRMTGLVQPGGLAEAGGAPMPQGTPPISERGAGLPSPEEAISTAEKQLEWTGLAGVGEETPTTGKKPAGFKYSYEEYTQLMKGREMVGRATFMARGRNWEPAK